MEWLDPADHRLWKADLMAGRVDLEFAAAVGERLAAIHRATAGDAAVAAMFPTGAAVRGAAARALSPRHRPAAPGARRAARRRSPTGPRRRSWRWSMATSAPRTSWPARTARSSSMPNAPGTAIRPSTSPSASTTCCSSASPCRPASADFLDRLRRAPRRLSRRRDVGGAGGARGARGVAPSRRCFSPGWTASRRSNTSPATKSATGSGASPCR